MDSEPTPPPAVTAPPPQVAYASYPRGYNPQAYAVYGTSEKLERAFKGYQGLSFTFLWSVLGWLTFVFGVAMAADSKMMTIGFALLAVSIGVLGLAIYSGVRACQNVGFAVGWSAGLGIFLGLVTVIGGIIPIAVLQHFAISEMNKYGVRSGVFMGIRKKDVLATVEQFKAYEASIK